MGFLRSYFLGWFRRHHQPMRGSHWHELTNETNFEWDLINSIQDPDLQCWNFLVCTRANLDTTQPRIYWVSSVQHSGHTRSSSVSRAQYAESVICEAQLQSRDYMTVKGFRALDNEICWVSPGWGQKAVEITKITQIAAQLPAPADGHLCKKGLWYLTWEIKDNKYQHQLLSELFVAVEWSWANNTDTPRTIRKLKLTTFSTKCKMIIPSLGLRGSG